MATGRDHWIRDIMSGDARGIGPAALRGALSIAEPGYRLVTGARNALFDREWKSVRRLPRPVISVGNLTTGGTGKTPAVVWLANRLRAELGLRAAVLLRGYKADATHGSDEAQLLRDALPGVPVIANPDRFAGGSAALTRGEPIDAFILDDGFQHRRLHRAFDLVLLDATNPFGYGHVLPRGMLREGMGGLSRADAILVTRADLADEAALSVLQATARRHAGRDVPIHHCRHGLGLVTLATDPPSVEPIDSLRGRRAYVIAGIGNPAAFERSVVEVGADVVGRRFFPDHHAYTSADVDEVVRLARDARADRIVTTHKDRVKLQRLPNAERTVRDGLEGAGALAYVDVALTFERDDEARLFPQIADAICKTRRAGQT